MEPIDHNPAAGAILLAGDPDESLEAWTPQEFDHYTDLGLLRRDVDRLDAD